MPFVGGVAEDVGPPAFADPGSDNPRPLLELPIARLRLISTDESNHGCRSQPHKARRNARLSLLSLGRGKIVGARSEEGSAVETHPLGSMTRQDPMEVTFVPTIVKEIRMPKLHGARKALGQTIQEAVERVQHPTPRTWRQLDHHRSHPNAEQSKKTQEMLQHRRVGPKTMIVGEDSGQLEDETKPLRHRCPPASHRFRLR